MKNVYQTWGWGGVWLLADNLGVGQDKKDLYAIGGSGYYILDNKKTFSHLNISYIHFMNIFIVVKHVFIKS